MTYRDSCCRCPTLETFPVGRALLCVSPFFELGPPGASVTTAADFAPQPTGAVVTPITPPDIGDCTGTESPALNVNGEYSEYFGAAGSPANAPTPERDDFGVTNSTSQAKATEGKAGTAGVNGPVRRSTTGMGLRVGEASADLPATSEFMDATAGETAPSPRTLKNGSAARAVRWGLDLQRLPCTSIPNGGSLKSLGVALCVSHETLLATPASGSGAAAGETATNFSSSDGPASNSPCVARYPLPGRTFCIGCDAPASGFFCASCADLDATISTLDADWRRAWEFNPALSSIPPAFALEAEWFRATNSCGRRDEAHPVASSAKRPRCSERQADAPLGQQPRVGIAPDPQDSDSPAMASPGSKGAAFPPMTAGASASVGASAFSVEIEPIDIPEFLPCRSNLMETP